MPEPAMKLDGGRELRHLFEELPKRVRTKHLRRAVTTAATPIVKEVKSHIKKQTGTLRKAITKKVKTYKGGATAVAVIGAKKGVTGPSVNLGSGSNNRIRRMTPRVPSRYFHLFDKGAAPHTVNGHAHPGVKGSNALENAWESKKDQAGNIMLNTLKTGLENEAANLAAKR